MSADQVFCTACGHRAHFGECPYLLEIGTDGVKCGCVQPDELIRLRAEVERLTAIEKKLIDHLANLYAAQERIQALERGNAKLNKERDEWHRGYRDQMMENVQKLVDAARAALKYGKLYGDEQAALTEALKPFPEQEKR